MSLPAPSPPAPSPPAAGPEPDAAPPRRGWQLITDRVFGAFFAGKLVSTIGIWVHNIAAAILVFELTGSALLVGAVTVGQFLPQLLLTPFSGAQADRGDRRRQVIVGRLVAASGSGLLVAWSLLVGLEGRAGAGAVIAAAVIVGVGFALGGPAMGALVPSLVRREELASAIALSASPFTIARVAGPAIGAVLVATVGATAAFGLAALTNLAFAAVLWRLPIPSRARRAGRDTSIRAGLRYVRADAAMLGLLIGTAAIGVGTDPLITLTPSLAADLGQDAGFVGVLASSFGLGAAGAFLVLGLLRRRLGLERLGVAGMLTLAAGLVGLAAAAAPGPAVVAAVVGGVGLTAGLTSLTTIVQQRVPDELRGRMMALWSVAFLGSRPLAAGTSGALADATSVTVALALSVVVVLAGAVVVRRLLVTRAAAPPSAGT